MKMNSNENYFAFLASIITEDVDAYVHMIKYIKAVVHWNIQLSENGL